MESLGDQLTILWSEFSWWTALLVFVAYFVADALYARYTLSVSKLESVRAATTGALMYFLLAIGILNFTHNPLYLLPLVLGSWLGTFFAVEREKKE